MRGVSITFHGATIDEVARDIIAWLGVAARSSRAPSAHASDAPAIAVSCRESMANRAADSCPWLAEAGRLGESVELSPELMNEFGVASGTAFAGMIGPGNRRAKRRMGRELIDRPSADSGTRVWRVAPEHAQAALEAPAQDQQDGQGAR